MKAAALALGLVLMPCALRADEAPCAPRVLEKQGARFVEVCGAGVLLSDAPLACAADGGEACEPVTALAPAPREPGRPNRHVDALVTGGEAARKLCRERFAARLPTPAERARARDLGFASVVVREEPGEFARLRLDEEPEWVEEAGRLARVPAARPHAAGEALLGCVAEPALPRARAVPLGSVCGERPLEAEVRSPDCALEAPGGARFELGCDPAHLVRSRAAPEHAAFRCVLPASALPGS
jgi:hypothetical protein